LHDFFPPLREVYPKLSLLRKSGAGSAVKDGEKKIKGEKVYQLSCMPVTSLAPTFDVLGSEESKALLFCGDSSHLALPDQSIDLVVTDPPYFDFVHYSELADFFYSWLRLGLQQTRGEFGPETTRHSQEVQQRDARAFSIALGRVFLECTRVLKPEGLLVFSFHHSRNEGWEAIGQAIFEANLEVVAAHPIKAEMSGASPKSQAASPINYDAILVCKRLFTPISVSLEAALKDVLERTREKLRVLSQDTHLSNLSNGDRFVIIQSQALCVFSQHNGYVIDDLGESVTLSRFLLATARSLNTISAHDDKQVEEMAERAAF